MTAVPTRISSIRARRSAAPVASGWPVVSAGSGGSVVTITRIIYLAKSNSSTATISITGSINDPSHTETPHAVCADDRATAGLLVRGPARGRPARRGGRIRDVPAVRPLRQLPGCHGAPDDRRVGRARRPGPRDDDDPDRRDGLAGDVPPPGQSRQVGHDRRREVGRAPSRGRGSRLEPGRARSPRLPVPADRRARGDARGAAGDPARPLAGAGLSLIHISEPTRP